MAFHRRINHNFSPPSRYTKLLSQCANLTSAMDLMQKTNRSVCGQHRVVRPIRGGSQVGAHSTADRTDDSVQVLSSPDSSCPSGRSPPKASMEQCAPTPSSPSSAVLLVGGPPSSPPRRTNGFPPAPDSRAGEERRAGGERWSSGGAPARSGEKLQAPAAAGQVTISKTSTTVSSEGGEAGVVEVLRSGGVVSAGGGGPR